MIELCISGIDGINGTEFKEEFKKQFEKEFTGTETYPEKFQTSLNELKLNFSSSFSTSCMKFTCILYWKYYIKGEMANSSGDGGILSKNV